MFDDRYLPKYFNLHEYLVIIPRNVLLKIKKPGNIRTRSLKMIKNTL